MAMTKQKRGVFMAALAAGLASTSAMTGSAKAAIVLDESFTYTDGALITTSAGAWVTHSGTAGQVDVASGKVNVTESESEDVSRSLTGAPYTTGLLYAAMDVTFTSLPSTAAGTYFYHFKDATTSGFRGRVYAMTTGAATGTLRFGIADTTTTVAAIPVDIALNTTHRLVIANDPSTGRSTLYLDSPTETGGTVATDATTPLAISTIALRQSAGEGVLNGDNLRVATSYAEAYSGVPEPTGLAFLAVGAVGLLHRRRSRA
jgi:hypothetical protein